MRSLRCQSQIYPQSLPPSPQPVSLPSGALLSLPILSVTSISSHGPFVILWRPFLYIFLFLPSSPFHFIFVYIFSPHPHPPSSARFGGIASCFKGISYAGSVSFVSLWRECLAENGALRLVMKNEIEK